jgi:hypothetical protein
MTSSCKILWKQAGRYWKMLKVWAFQGLLEIIRVWRRRNCRGSCLATFDGNATRSLKISPADPSLSPAFMLDTRITPTVHINFSTRFYPSQSFNIACKVDQPLSILWQMSSSS